MYDIQLLDNLNDFVIELLELLEQDWIKFKKFVKEYKKYVMWLLALMISAQFINIMSIGKSWNNYSKRNKIINDSRKLYYGGANTNPDFEPKLETESDPKKTESESDPKKTESEIKSDPNAKTDPKSDPNAKNDPKKTESEIKSDPNAKNESKPKNESDDGELKATDKKISFLEKLKGDHKILGKHGSAGPVFNNLDKIFDSIGSMFAILGFILAFIGILSIPVLIFLVITYNVLKKMLNHFLIL